MRTVGTGVVPGVTWNWRPRGLWSVRDGMGLCLREARLLSGDKTLAARRALGSWGPLLLSPQFTASILGRRGAPGLAFHCLSDGPCL